MRAEGISSFINIILTMTVINTNMYVCVHIGRWSSSSLRHLLHDKHRDWGAHWQMELRCCSWPGVSRLPSATAPREHLGHRDPGFSFGKLGSSALMSCLSFTRAGGKPLRTHVTYPSEDTPVKDDNSQTPPFIALSKLHTVDDVNPPPPKARFNDNNDNNRSLQ